MTNRAPSVHRVAQLLLGLCLACLIGCSRSTAIDAEEASAWHSEGNRGWFRIQRAETIHVYVFARHTGFETQGWECEGDDVPDSLTSSDPSIVLVVPLGLREHDINGSEESHTFLVTGMSEGEATLTATCTDRTSTLKIEVVAP